MAASDGTGEFMKRIEVQAPPEAADDSDAAYQEFVLRELADAEEEELGSGGSMSLEEFGREADKLIAEIDARARTGRKKA